MNATLRQLLEDVEAGKIGPQLQARAKRYLDLHDPERRRVPEKTEIASVEHARAKKAADADAESQAKRDMHDAVFAWNREHTMGRGAPFGRCDCGCGTSFRHRDDGECDHFIPRSRGGEHTRENGWRLIGGEGGCHWRKTNNAPPEGGGTWNARRRAYCSRAGVPFVALREKSHG